MSFCAVLLVLAAALVVSSRSLDADPWNLAKMKKPALITPGDQSPVSISGLAGYRCLSADFLWVETMQYLGDAKSRREGYRFFPAYISRIVRLDPNFTYAYLNGSAVMMWLMKKTDLAIEFLQSGVKANPDNGEINRYLFAFTYYRAGDLRHMLPILEQLVVERKHPPMVERIMSNLYEKLGETEKARLFWYWMIDQASEPENVEYAKKKLKEYGK